MREEKNRGGRAGGPSTPLARRGKGRSEQQDTPSHVQRMLTRLGLTFKGVEDPRKDRGERHGLEALLSLLVQGLAVGKRVLRRLEDLSEDLVREGIGLAATQVDVHRRLLVTDVSADKDDPHVFPCSHSRPPRKQAQHS